MQLNLPKWQILLIIQHDCPDCLKSCDQFFEDFIYFCKSRQLEVNDGAIEFCRWRGEAV